MMETVREGASAARAQSVIFDFDGTLSLVRAGWMRVMVPMMLEVLTGLRTGESEAEMRALIEAFIWRLTGKETIYQMMALADAVRARGAEPLAAERYQQRFLEGLAEVTQVRVDELQRGVAPPDRYLVPGTRRLLEELRGRGLRLYLASGTDQEVVKEEAALLDIARYFDGGIFGGRPDFTGVSKRALIERIVTAPGSGGDRLLGFGDGAIEIGEIRRAGGVAVGLATDETTCLSVDQWKRERLIEVGADYIIPNYLCHDELLDTLFAEGVPTSQTGRQAEPEC